MKWKQLLGRYQGKFQQDNTQKKAFTHMVKFFLMMLLLTLIARGTSGALMARVELTTPMYTYLFPILRYHDRWSQLTSEDLTYWFHRDTVSHNGYLVQTGVKPYTAAYVEPPLADYSFGESSWHYLDKMVQLCAGHGTQLVLIKAPSLSPVWWDQWDAQIEEYADQHGLLYINMLDYQEEIGIDWNTDTYDAGLHLNVWGAEKLSRWFGYLLAEECSIPDRRSEFGVATAWNEKKQSYEKEKNQ